MNPKRNFSLLMLIVLIPGSFAYSFNPRNSLTAIECNYVDVIACGEGFIAITNEGEINWLAKDGKILHSMVVKNEHFSSLLADNDQAFVAGNSGISILHWSDTTLQKIPLETAGVVCCMTLLRGQLVAATKGGVLYVGVPNNDFRTVQLTVKGNIVALSANTSVCYGVTDMGEIIHSADGLNWEVFDFNKTYEGYYKPCSFTGLYAMATQIAVVGKDADDAPVLYFSSKGNVWAERTLLFDDASGRQIKLDDTITDIFYDQTLNQFILVTVGGTLLTLPSCSHCNKLYNITEKQLNSISGTDGLVIIAGEQGFIEIIKTEFL